MNERTRFWVLCGVVAAVIAVLVFAFFGGGDGLDDTAVETAVTIEEADSAEDFAEGPGTLAEPAAVLVASGLAGSRAAAGSIRRDSAAKGSGLIRGVVLHRDGSPAAGAAVRARWTSESAPLVIGRDDTRYALTADAEGRFEIAGAAEGRYAFRAEAGGYGGTQWAYIRGSASMDVTIALTGQGRLAGRVVDEDGVPVAGAWVWVAPSRGGVPYIWSDEMYGVESGDTGAFSFSGLTGGTVNLLAVAEGYGTAVSDPVTPDREDIVITLERGGAIAGVVRDEATGEPVPGVALSFTGRAFAAAAATAVSDETGRFETGPLGAGGYTAAVVEGAYRLAGDRAPIEVAAGERVERDLTVALGGVVAGVVVRKPGMEPVSGVTVAAYRGDGTPGQHDSEPTGGDGSFAIEGLGQGLYSLTASGPGAGQSVETTRAYVPKGGRVDGLEIALSVAGIVEGVVLYPDGRPAPGAVVRGADWNVQHVHAVADDEGRFRLTGVEVTTLVKVFASLGALRSKAAGPLAFDGNGVVRTELRLEEAFTGTIAGRVVDEAGRGVVGASVTITMMTDYGSEQRSMSVEIDGRFSFTVLPPGAYRVSASKDGYYMAESLVELLLAANERAEGIVLTLAAGEKIEVAGVVLDADGRPAAGAAVVGMGQQRWAAVTDGRGAFTLTGVFGDHLSITASHEELGRVQEGFIPPRTGVTLRLNPPDAVRGRVVDGESGLPITRFQIGLTQASTLEAASAQHLLGSFATFIDPEGRFEYDTSSEGIYHAVVIHQGEAPVRVIGAIARAEGYAPSLVRAHEQEEVLITLFRGRQIAGRVVDGGGRPVAGASVQTGRSQAEARGESLPGNEVTDTAGAFAMAGVPEGVSIVSATHPNFAATAVAIPGQGDVTDVEIRMTGGGALRVVAVPTGWPGSRITVTLQNDGVSYERTLDADLTALFEDVAGGAYRVNAVWNIQRNPNLFDSHWVVRTETTVVDGQTTEFTIPFPPYAGVVEGVVSRGGRAVAGASVRLHQETDNGRGILNAYTGDDGVYITEGVPAGSYEVEAQIEEWTWNGRLDMSDGAGVRFDIDMDVPFVAGGEER